MGNEQPETTSIRWRPEDLKLIEALRKKTGIKAAAEIMRMGLRALAREQGIKV